MLFVVVGYKMFFFPMLFVLLWWCERSVALVCVGAPDGLAPVGVERLRKAGLEVVFESTEAAEAVIIRSATRVDEAWLERHPLVRVVARAGVGVDNVDVAACVARGVAVANTPTASTIAVAELAVGHLLSALRRLPVAQESVRAGRFLDFKGAAGGREAYGKTLGIVGFGAVGQRVAHVAQALGMNVIACSSSVKERVSFCGSLRELFETSDVVSVHVPLAETTRNLVDYDLLSCAQNLHLVNVARGGIVVESDVIRALDAKHLATYSTDVFATEPPDITSPLLTHPSVFLSAHIGAATPEAQDRVSLGVADAVIALLHNDRIDGDSSLLEEEEEESSWRLLVPPRAPHKSILL